MSETNERRIELNAAQTLLLHDLYRQRADMELSLHRFDQHMKAELEKVTGPSENGNVMWRMDIGEEIVELVEVLPDESGPAVLP